MKKSILILICFFTTLSLHSQIRLESQFGGSNFLGFSINSEYDIPIHSKTRQFLTPSFGIGSISSHYAKEVVILHFGLNYRIHKIGFGVEASTFESFASSEQLGLNDFLDLLVYPNVNYSFSHKNLVNWYLKLSVGAYFGYQQNPFGTGSEFLISGGNVIPGAGLSLGYSF